MHLCPECGEDLGSMIYDVVRKTDYAHFQCPECGADLVADVKRTITIEVDEDV